MMPIVTMPYQKGVGGEIEVAICEGVCCMLRGGGGGGLAVFS